MDAIYIMKQIAEEGMECNNPAFPCFVDLIKIFCRIKYITEILKKHIARLKIIKVIEEFNQTVT